VHNNSTYNSIIFSLGDYDFNWPYVVLVSCITEISGKCHYSILFCEFTLLVQSDLVESTNWQSTIFDVILIYVNNLDLLYMLIYNCEIVSVVSL
jgi:hypothetical protein